MTGRGNADALALVGLDALMAATRGRPEVGIGLVDGPVAVDHPELAEARIQVLPGADDREHEPVGARAHATFLAGVLVARRDATAPAICPDCTLLVRAVFDVSPAEITTASPTEVGRAIVECVDAGARIVNLSAAASRPTPRAEPHLRAALDHAQRSGALCVTAAGNQGTLGGSELLRHPGAIPVAACGLDSRPAARSNLGASVGRHGLLAPGEHVVSLSPGGSPAPGTGASVAAAVVTGAIALMWSLVPNADAREVRRAVLGRRRRTSVLPPLLDARAARAALDRVVASA